MPTHIRCKGNIGKDLQTVQVDVVIVKKLDPNRKIMLCKMALMTIPN
jgi:hypothetical protein